MVDAARLKRIMSLAMPIIGGMVSQNVLNLVDTAMVGTLGNAALAAVGLGGFVLFMCMALVLGVSTGVQTTAARRKGEGRHSETAMALNGALLLVLMVAPVLSALLYLAAPVFYPWINSDPAVIREGVPYLQIRLLSIVFIGANFAFRGYWNAVDLSRLYMSTLLVMHASNIFLNYVLIFGHFGAPALGVYGAGLASALSTVIGTSMYMMLGWKFARSGGFMRALPGRGVFAGLVRLSLPSGIQQLAFAAGFVATYWIVGLVGTRELAAASVLINVTLVAILPGLGLGLSAATLVGQALGRNNVDDAQAWGWDVVKVAAVVLTVLGAPMWLLPDPILGVFIHDPLTLEVARWPMRLVGMTMIVEAVGMVLMHALMGAGDVRRVTRIAITAQWLVFLPMAYLVGPVLGLGLFAIWIMQGVYRGGQAFFFYRLWQQRKWAGIKV